MFEKLEKLADSLWLNEILYKYSTSENGKYGVCDVHTEIVLPVIFDKIEMSADKQIVGEIDGKFYYFKVRFENNRTKAELSSIFYVDSNGEFIEDDEIPYEDRLKELFLK